MTLRYRAAWAGLAVLVLAVDGTSAASTGLLAQTVCISPAAFLVVAMVPAETLVELVMNRLPIDDTRKNASERVDVDDDGRKLPDESSR